MPGMNNAEIIEVVTAYADDEALGLRGLLETRWLGTDNSEWQSIPGPAWAFSRCEYRYTPAARMPAWVNFYETNGAPRTGVTGVYCYQSRALADAQAGAGRIACVNVCPGDGLEDVDSYRPHMEACDQVIKIIRKRGRVRRGPLLKASRMPAKELSQCLETLTQSEQVGANIVETKGGDTSEYFAI